MTDETEPTAQPDSTPRRQRRGGRGGKGGGGRTGGVGGPRRRLAQAAARRGNAGDSRGVCFAATGETYTILARRAARSLRQAMPEAQVDLFTDQPVTDPVFNQIHPLDHGFFRPKMEAIRRSRFDRTLMLDADVLVMTDVSDLFDLLDRWEMAGAHAFNRDPDLMETPENDIPRAFAPINSGVLAVRRTPRTTQLMEDWEQALRDSDDSFDQPSLRRLLYRSEVDFIAVPVEYNLIYLASLETWNGVSGAPRIIHSRRLHQKENPGNPKRAFTLDDAMNADRAAHVRRLMEADWSMGGDRYRPVVNMAKAAGPRTLRQRVGHGLRWLRWRARRLVSRTDSAKPVEHGRSDTGNM